MNESDENKMINLLKEQKNIKATILRSIETILDQKISTKLQAKNSLKESYKELQILKTLHFGNVLKLLKECDKLVPGPHTIALSYIKQKYQFKDVNFNEKIQSIVDAESDQVYSRLKSFNASFFEAFDSNSEILIRELRKFVLFEKNDDDISFQIKKLTLQNSDFMLKIRESLRVN